MGKNIVGFEKNIYYGLPMKKKILVIDDNEDVLKLMKDILEENNFESLTFNSPVEALKSLAVSKPNMIVVDLMMPQMSGIGLIRELKRQERTRHIPFVVLTSVVDDDVESEVRGLGAVGYLGKDRGHQQIVPILQKFAI